MKQQTTQEVKIMNTTSEQIKVDYKGYEITYSESCDDWECSLGGRKTLKRVKSLIDKHTADEETFERFDAFFVETYSGVKAYPQYSVVTVTSKATYNTYWVTGKDNGGDVKRRKVAAHNLYRVTPDHQESVKTLKSLDVRLDEVRNEISDAKNGFKSLYGA